LGVALDAVGVRPVIRTPELVIGSSPVFNFRSCRAGTALATAVVMRARRPLVALYVTVLSLTSLHAQSSVTELNDAGWKALRDGNNDRAATFFAEALTLRPKDPVLLFGSGAAAHAQGKQRDAMARLQRALESKPNLTIASRLLGQIAFDEGEVDLAIRTYEKALTHAPDDVDLRNALDAVRRDAGVHHSFEERRYDRFRVMFEGRAEESLATQATAVFNSVFFRIGDTLGEFPSNTIVAVLYTEKQFRDITRAPEWSGGQYDGRIRIPAAGASLKPELFERVLTHELTHAVVAGIVANGVPTWLNEGLAQSFDGTDPQAARRRMKASGRSVPLKKLENGFGHLSAADAQVAYDESLLAVGVMFDRPGFGWTRLLHRLADGQSFEDAIGNFGFSYSDLEAPFAR
jgi:tetratricopeptide (TPR) repeat protein